MGFSWINQVTKKLAAKQHPANILLNSISFFLLFLIPFMFVRLYFYFNFYYASNTFQAMDFLTMLFTGLRFDLCVVGFLTIPSYLFYVISYNEKLNAVCIILNSAYRANIVLLAATIININIPFMAANSAFDVPHWMRWEDYLSLLGIDCRYCYRDYFYNGTAYPIQILSALMFFLIFLSAFSKWTFFSKGFSWRREVFFIVLIGLMARGKLGQHHLRYEDSLWHSNALLNELSNNPLWLIDKRKN